MYRLTRLIFDLKVWWMLFKFRVWGRWIVLDMRLTFALRRFVRFVRRVVE